LPITLSTPIPNLYNTTVGDFWAWAYSDMLSNVNRGVFAEFLVATALGVTEQPRIEWNAYDLLYKGKPIEVKTSAYRQSWPQSRPSRISFDVAAKRSWYAGTNTYSETLGRPAECYVFCLFAEPDLNKANVLDLTQWRFYVLPTTKLMELVGAQKTIGLRALEKACSFTLYEKLRTSVDFVFGLD